MERRSYGATELWSVGVMERRNYGAPELWSVGVMERRSYGASELWSVGVVDRRDIRLRISFPTANNSDINIKSFGWKNTAFEWN